MRCAVSCFDLGWGLQADVHLSGEDSRNTALHHACTQGHLRAVIKLLEYGANPNAVNKKEETPLHLAASGPEVAILKALISKVHALRFSVLVRNLGECTQK